MGCRHFFCYCCCCCCKEDEHKGEEVEAMYMDVSTLKEKNNTLRVVQALYDYYNTAAYCPPGHLSFSKDQCFEVLEEQGNWLVVATDEGSQGLVPSNYVEIVYDKRWYFTDINSRLEAEILLSHHANPIGAFLVRRAHHSNASHTYSLSVLKDEDIFYHYRIYSQGKSFSMVQGDLIHFRTLHNLVQDCIGKNYISVACIRETIPPSIDISEFKEELIDADSITLVKPIGKGRAGQVYLGHWHQNVVAIKKIKSPIGLSELKKEASMLKKCIHKNIVTMYGICVKDTIMIIQEYIKDGSVQDVMKRPDVSFKYRTLQYIGHQVACGMAYLERKNIVHCDIAARNILISFEGKPLIIKIADFGMAKCLEKPIYMTTNPCKPIRWTAPEVLEQGKVSIKSDVWSYGIFLMELFTNCRLPYNEIPSNLIVVEKVQNGYTMKQPQDFNVLKADYDLMKACWELNPNMRPTFKTVQRYFEREGSKWRLIDVAT